MATDQQTTEQQLNTSDVKKDTKKSISFMSILWLIFLLLVILSIPLFLIRLNVMGAGDFIRPYIKSNSKLVKILPPTHDPNNIELMNREQLINLINDYKAKIEVLEKEVDVQKNISKQYTNDPEGLKKFAQAQQDLKTKQNTLDEQLTRLKEAQEIFFNKVVRDDPSGFKSYFEGLDPQAAERIYTSIIEDQKAEQAIRDYVDYYESMDLTSAINVLEKTAKSDMNLVIRIFKYMDKQKVSQILSKMDSNIASRILNVLGSNTGI